MYTKAMPTRPENFDAYVLHRPSMSGFNYEQKSDKQAGRRCWKTQHKKPNECRSNQPKNENWQQQRTPLGQLKKFRLSFWSENSTSL